MKTAKTFANIAVLSLGLSFIPVAGAQQSTTAQKPAAQKPPAQKAAVANPPTANANKAPARNPEASPGSQPKARKAPAKPAAIAQTSVAKIQKPAKTASGQPSVARVRKHPVAGAEVGQAPAPSAAPGAESAEPVVTRRDPFSPLVYVAREGGGTGEHLPPGKAGLVVATVRVDGAVQSPNGMIAVLVNPQQRVYFVHEGDRLYDGAVEKISLDGVTFKESSKDAFGKPVERLVTKRIYPSAGEQQ